MLSLMLIACFVLVFFSLRISRDARHRSFKVNKALDAGPNPHEIDFRKSERKKVILLLSLVVICVLIALYQIRYNQ